jgi:hypothetical protein
MSTDGKKNPKMLDQKQLREYLAVCDKCPPVLVRFMFIIAGKGRKPHLGSQVEIINRSGLSRRYVQYLTWRNTWAGVTFEAASRFIAACNVDMFHKSPRPGSKKMTRYYFYRNYIMKDLPHITDEEQKARLKEIMGWKW